MTSNLPSSSSEVGGSAEGDRRSSGASVTTTLQQLPGRTQPARGCVLYLRTQPAT